MKKLFSSYFTPQPDFFKALWSKAYFALDTNVLLDLYRYSDKTRSELIVVLTSLKDRIWIPHQVGLEFAYNRPEVISTQVEMYQKAQDFIKSLRAAVQKEINTTFSFRNHPVLNPDEFRKSLESVLNDLSEKIDKYQRFHPDFFSKDPVLVALCDLLDGRVGPSYDSTRMEEIFKVGKLRYGKSIPPGYADSTGPGKKEGDAIYGDLVLWFQLIDQAKVLKKPFIFVSSDLKEDWWWQPKGRTMGCRPELRDEFFRESGQDFYMYTSNRFLEYATQYLKVQVSVDSIKEIKSVQKEDQRQQAESVRNYAGSLLEKIIDNQVRFNATIAQINTPTMQHIVEQIKNQENALTNLTKSPFLPLLQIQNAFVDQIKRYAQQHQMIGISQIPNAFVDQIKQFEQQRQMIETQMGGPRAKDMNQLFESLNPISQTPCVSSPNEETGNKPSQISEDDPVKNK